MENLRYPLQYAIHEEIFFIFLVVDIINADEVNVERKFEDEGEEKHDELYQDVPVFLFKITEISCLSQSFP